MQILQHNMDGRLPVLGRAIAYENRQDDEDYFLIVHPRDQTEYKSEIKNFCETQTQEDHCKGILFVKGTPYANLGKKAADELQCQYNGKVHFLSYAVAHRRDLPPGYEDRFNDFFHKIENENIIDWDLIDPTYPESIVAALLLLHAAPLCSEPEKRKNIWESAVAEYNSRSKEKLDKKLNWGNTEKIQEQAKKLNKFLSGRQA